MINMCISCNLIRILDAIKKVIMPLFLDVKYI